MQCQRGNSLDTFSSTVIATSLIRLSPATVSLSLAFTPSEKVESSRKRYAKKKRNAFSSRCYSLQSSLYLPLSLFLFLPPSPFLQSGRDKATSAGLRRPYLRVVGFDVDSEGPGRASGVPLTPSEEEELRQLASRPDIYETVAKSIAPSIYGSLG